MGRDGTLIQMPWVLTCLVLHHHSVSFALVSAASQAANNARPQGKEGTQTWAFDKHTDLGSMLSPTPGSEGPRGGLSALCWSPVPLLPQQPSRTKGDTELLTSC